MASEYNYDNVNNGINDNNLIMLSEIKFVKRWQMEAKYI